MDNAQLNFGLRVFSLYRIWEPFKAIDTSNQDIFQSTILEFSENRQPELCTLCLSQP